MRPEPVAITTPAPSLLRDAEIREDTTWEGNVLIDGSVKVFKGATLTILPGTDVAFVRRDDDQDGLGDGTLTIEGGLIAVGTPQAPIRFRSAEDVPRPGDWLEIRTDFSREVHLRWCEITDSAYGLHAHFTRALVEDCVIRGNIDGFRLGQASVVIRNCLVESNEGKGINFRNTGVEITRNIIRHNGSGIFLFESDRDFTVRENNIYGNDDNFRLGDFYTGNVVLEENWWGTADPQGAAATVYDSKYDPEIGTVTMTPASQWISGTGPRMAAEMKEAWRHETGGFVDASPVVADRMIFVPGWDGRLRALDDRGRLEWARDLGDVIDAAAAVDDDTVYVQSWQREVFALDRRSGAKRWSFEYSPSPADDHRQGGVVRTGELLLVPAWNGTLYALEARTGEVRWRYAGGFPLRSTPAVDKDRIYLSSGSGLLSALDFNGTTLWSRDLGAPLLTPPAITPFGPAAISREGMLVALDRAGEERWRLDLSEICTYASPLYHHRALYLATAAGTLWKVDAENGNLIWRRPGAAPLYAAPLLDAGRLVLPDNDGTLHIVGADSGDILTTYEVGGAVQGTPARVGNLLVFGSRDHTVYALRFL